MDVAQVGRAGVALHLAHLFVGGGQFAAQFPVVPGLAREAVQVFQGMLHQGAARRRGPGEAGDLRLDFEEHRVRQLPHVVEPAVRPPRLPGGGGQPCHEGQHDERAGQHGGLVAPDELAGPVGERAGARQHRQAVPVAADVLGEERDAAVAPGRLLAERQRHDAVQVAAQPPPQPVGRLPRGKRLPGAVRVRAADQGAGAAQFLGADGLRDFHRPPAFQPVGPLAGEQLAEDHPQAVHVAGGGDRLAAQLLRAGVLRGHRAVERRRRLAGVVRVGGDELGDAEVEQLGFALGRDPDVGGLEVAVDDEVLVRVADGRAHLAEERQPPGNPQAARVAVAVQPLALDVLHDEIGTPFGRHRRGVEPGDARVRQPGQHAPLVLELPAPRVVAEMALEQLDGDAAFQLRVLGQVHLAHAALAQQGEDAAVAQQVARPEFAVADHGDGRTGDAAGRRFAPPGHRRVVSAGFLRTGRALVPRLCEGGRLRLQRAIRFGGWHIGLGARGRREQVRPLGPVPSGSSRAAPAGEHSTNRPGAFRREVRSRLHPPPPQLD